MPGGLAVIVIAVCALFTTFTGGSGVTIIAIGGLVLPHAARGRLPGGLLARPGDGGRAAWACSSRPACPVILYSVVAGTREQNVPADSLYLAGLLPGILMIADGGGLRRTHRAIRCRRAAAGVLGPREVAAATWEAKWELLLPVFVVGLFVSGRASMVETAAARPRLRGRRRVLHHARPRTSGSALPAALVKSSVLTGAVLILLSAAMGITSYIVDAQIPDALVAWVRAHIQSRWSCSCWRSTRCCSSSAALVDIYSAIVVLAPLIVPMAAAFGVHPIHLGVIFLANLELGFLSPAGRPEPVPRRPRASTSRSPRSSGTRAAVPADHGGGGAADHLRARRCPSGS